MCEKCLKTLNSGLIEHLDLIKYEVDLTSEAADVTRKIVEPTRENGFFFINNVPSSFQCVHCERVKNFLLFCGYSSSLHTPSTAFPSFFRNAFIF